ncbi:alanine racemase [Roseimicrobium gellanilyticum]|uniref:Alanine racemase n=1 Tax=Roseimicrobium gellanilyticum TaxID=748857 RepID=A0A366HB75_9BACT|nr:alanine racemase [Roseimicrobium gellanilyticum]RBP39612.1 alanine racemase [Roseimicrobium gellanilyticum]
MDSPTLPHRCWTELSADALRHNAAVAREQGGAEIMAVVKANAYGHGAVWAARILQDRVAMFGVANLQEAQELRLAGIEKPSFLLSPCLPEEWEPAVRMGCHISVSSLQEAIALDRLAQRTGVRALLHAVVDTGMGRIGFLEEAWDESSIAALSSLKFVSWEGINTHLPSADEDAAFTRAQLARFRQAVEKARAMGLRPKWIHSSNSAGLLGYEEQRGWCTLTRPGLMLYGISPLPEEQSRLKPVLTWKTRVTQVRELPAGHGVSYGCTYITERPTRVATLACGYADGYPRQVSGHGAQVLIGSTLCPLLGRVTMDQIMVDVTARSDAKPGDEVILIGAHGTSKITATEVAAWAETIEWHVFTGIGPRVPRVG